MGWVSQKFWTFKIYFLFDKNRDRVRAFLIDAITRFLLKPDIRNDGTDRWQIAATARPQQAKNDAA